MDQELAQTYMTIEEAQTMLGLGTTKAVLRLIERGLLCAVRVHARLYLLRRADVDAYRTARAAA